MSYVIVPEGQAPPFETVDDKHHSAWVIITAAIELSVSLVCLLIRIYVRLFLSPPFGLSDSIVVLATFIATVQSIVIFVAAHSGFGTSVDLLESFDVNNIHKMLVAGDVLYLITIFLAKASVVIIFLRLTPKQSHNTASWLTGGICGLWLVSSVFILAIDCKANSPWAPPAEQCSNLFSRWEFITVVNGITEIVFFVLSLVMVYGIQTPLSEKLVVLFAFGSRLPIVVFADFIELYIWIATEMNYSLIACTVFCLRPFMRAVSTNYGTAGDENLASSGRGSRSRTTKESGHAFNSCFENNGYPMTPIFRPFKNASDRSLLSTSSATEEGRLDECLQIERRLNTEISSALGTTTHETRDESSVASNDSTKMIIQKQVQYKVEY